MIPLYLSLAPLTGGALPMYPPLKQVEQRHLAPFAGGAIVSVALFDLIPAMQVGNGRTAGVFLYVGAGHLIPEAH